MISINTNLMATNTANTLTKHYGRLQTSTERLSSGLRINSAADDAAGLAIREMMRADIAALNQGVRNVNDAISMIQTFDGALSVIDEKLIRMKELAEQAATGTYTSDQRLMIDNEFQAMGEEINRIARATDFNGIKLIDGEFEASGTQITGPDGKTYDVALNGLARNFMGGAGATLGGAWDTSGIQNPGLLVGNHTFTIENGNIFRLGNANLVAVDISNGGGRPAAGTNFNISVTPNAFGPNTTTQIDFYDITGTTRLAQSFVPLGVASFNQTIGGITYDFSLADLHGNAKNFDTLDAVTGSWTAQPPGTFTKTSGPGTLNVDTTTPGVVTMEIDLGNNNKISQTWNLPGTDDRVLSSVTFNLNIRDTTAQPDASEGGEIPDDVVKIHFGTGNDSDEDYYYINKHDATLQGLGLDGVAIKTQNAAQNALVKVNDAIVEKDKIRAEYGAMQNRLENTMTNLKSQAENLQAAESRISDADIAQEMMLFVRNQILTQSAVAMLAQANSIPQMVMTLVR